MNIYNLSIQDVLDGVKSSKDGLSRKEAEFRLKKFGYNKIYKKEKFVLLKNLLKQFTDLLAIILVIAAFFSFVLGDKRDALVIIGIVFLNAGISFFQEYKAERAIEALRKLVPEKAKVIREGIEEEISVENVVSGDILVLEKGMKIPADLRLIEAYGFSTNDFTLTGESEPQIKFAKQIKEVDLSLTDIDNMVFMGTSVASGNALGVVVTTGMNTEFGKIAHLASKIEEKPSPLQKEITGLGKIIGGITFLIIFMIMIVGYFFHYNFLENLKFSLGIAASCVPEGLPATVSIALAIGVQKMAKKKAVIKKLSAVETLGSTTVIVTDKTGTLTRNEMTVKEIWFGNKEIHVKGVGYDLTGDFRYKNGEKLKNKDFSELEPLFKTAVLCNEASIDIDKKENRAKVLGDQTESSLLILSEKAGFNTKKVIEENKQIFELPFDSNRKCMTAINKAGGQIIAYTKGAPLEILNICKFILLNGKKVDLTEKLRKEIIIYNDKYASSAMRVLALAYKPVEKKQKYNIKDVEKDLVFLGLTATIDPPREEVKDAISLCKKAGVRIIMMTGDYQLTASAIAKRIGLSENPEVITGNDLNKMTDEDLISVLYHDNFFDRDTMNYDLIFARSDPNHKMRIVSILQNEDEIVAVTGDGVNDAPALKKSNVGVAMGITGTDVSKESAEMVLLNDSFASIVNAIREGRLIYENLKKFIVYILSSNATEFFTVFFGIFLGISPILAIQILFIDLGTDVFPSIALAVDPKNKDVMKRFPRNQAERLINEEVISFLSFIGMTVAFLAILVFTIILLKSGWQWGKNPGTQNFVYQKATTATYTTLVLAQFINSFNCRSFSEPLHKLFLGNKKLILANLFSLFLLFNVVYNPIFEDFFHTKPLLFSDWIIIIFALVIFFTILEFRKFRQRRKNKESYVLDR